MEEADHRRRTVLGDRLVAASAALNANKRPCTLKSPKEWMAHGATEGGRCYPPSFVSLLSTPMSDIQLIQPPMRHFWIYIGFMLQ